MGAGGEEETLVDPSAGPSETQFGMFDLENSSCNNLLSKIIYLNKSLIAVLNIWINVYLADPGSILLITVIFMFI